MKKILTLGLFCFVISIISHISVGQSIKTIPGSTSLDLKVTSPTEGKLYYVIYKAKLPTLPLDTIIQADAQKPLLNTIFRNGVIKITSELVKDTLLRAVTGLPSNSTLHLYWVFKYENGTFNQVQYKPISTQVRQLATSYTSQATTIAGKTVQYMIYKSEGYLKDTQKQKHPLIIYFHGDPKSTDVNILKSAGLPRYIDQGNNIDFIVASPLTYWPVVWYVEGWIDEFIEKIKREERIDPDKIYLTGLSSGGGGIYYYSSNFPQKIAGIVTACAVNPFWNTDFPDPNKNNYCSVKTIPIWAFHNQGDNVVNINNSATVVNSVNACKPSPPVQAKLTTLSASGHDAWTATYQNTSIYKWLLGIVKPYPTNLPPVITTNKTVYIATTYNAPITLSASATDPENKSKIKYHWHVRQGNDITIVNPDSSKLTVQDYKQGSYTFRVMATDMLGSTSYEDITLNIGSSTVASLTDPQLPSVNKICYPIPVENTLHFNRSVPATYTIRTLSGIWVKEGKGLSADVSQLTKGTYLIEIDGINDKFIKQ